MYYYFLAGHLLGSLDSNGTQFYLSDAQGSLVSSFNNASGGAVMKSNQLFGPYGNTRYNAGSLNTAKGFIGQYNDGTGLDYFNARYYDPVVGVFLSADTVQGNAQGMNPYGYVGGNPETHRDPSGRYTVGLNGSRAYTTPDGNGGVTVTTWIPLYFSPGTWWETVYHYNAQHLLDSLPRTPGNPNTGTSLTPGGFFQQIWNRVGAFLSNFWSNLTTPSGDYTLCGLLSFTPTTKVATSQGEKAIGSLHPGERVWAYNTKTHKMELQPIIHVWINHDNDLVDVTIASTIPAQHGKAAQKTSEVVHTNKKHPFLTVEKGFVPVSQLRVGMHVINASDGIGTITMLKAVPGAMTMYNLEVAQDHTYTVGKGEWIIHNCGVGPVGSNEDPTANITMQDILNNPQLLKNLSPQQVEQIVARDGGWSVKNTLNKTTISGMRFNQWNPRGTNFTDKYIQFHEGGGRHEPNPYWKVSTNTGGTVRVDYEGPYIPGGDIPPEFIDP